MEMVGNYAQINAINLHLKWVSFFWLSIDVTVCFFWSLCIEMHDNSLFFDEDEKRIFFFSFYDWFFQMHRCIPNEMHETVENINKQR